MNILWQTEHYPDARKGGGSVANTTAICRELRRLGQDVQVLARGNGRDMPSRELVEDLPVFRLVPPRLPDRLWPIWPLLEPRALRAPLAGLSRGFDAFVCHDPGYGLALKWLHPARPVVFRVAGAGRIHDACVARPSAWAGGSLADRKRRLARRLLGLQEDRMERAAWARADALVVQSEFMKRDVATFYRIPPDRIHVIQSGVDHDRLAAGAPTTHSLEILGDRAGAKGVIAFCGRLVAMKNVSYLLRAFALMRDRDRCLLAIAGDGDERGALEAEAVGLGISARVKFFGHVDRVEDVLAVADIFVLPSLYEPFGNALVEAMAAGLPCLALRPGPRVRTSGAEIIRDGDTGFLVSPDDPRHLAQRLDALVGDPARRVSMGSRARAWCGRTYRWSTCARGYLDTLQAGL